MSGAVSPHHLCAFMAYKGTTLPFTLRKETSWNTCRYIRGTCEVVSQIDLAHDMACCGKLLLMWKWIFSFQ